MLGVTYVRDPLSVLFDGQAGEAITRAIRQYERKRKNSSVRGWVEILVPNPLTENYVRETRPDRLSPSERAFQRALYYDARVHQLTRRAKPRSRYSLKCDWQPVPMLPGSPRRVRITLFRDTSGARHVEQGPRRESFVENPELRSTWVQDPQATART